MVHEIMCPIANNNSNNNNNIIFFSWRRYLDNYAILEKYFFQQLKDRLVYTNAFKYIPGSGFRAYVQIPNNTYTHAHTQFLNSGFKQKW